MTVPSVVDWTAEHFRQWLQVQCERPEAEHSSYLPGEPCECPVFWWLWDQGCRDHQIGIECVGDGARRAIRLPRWTLDFIAILDARYAGQAQAVGPLVCLSIIDDVMAR